jgi:hypothetical protein
MRTRDVGALAAAAVLLAACGRSPATPAPTQIIRPIQIDSVQVVVQASQVSVRVRGVVGDGCTELSGTSMSRADASVDIQILSQRPAEAICTQIALLYDETLRVPGEFTPGHYALRVNSVETSFDVP